MTFSYSLWAEPLSCRAFLSKQKKDARALVEKIAYNQLSPSDYAHYRNQLLDFYQPAISELLKSQESEWGGEALVDFEQDLKAALIHQIEEEIKELRSMTQDKRLEDALKMKLGPLPIKERDLENKLATILDFSTQVEELAAAVEENSAARYFDDSHLSLAELRAEPVDRNGQALTEDQFSYYKGIRYFRNLDDFRDFAKAHLGKEEYAVFYLMLFQKRSLEGIARESSRPLANIFNIYNSAVAVLVDKIKHLDEGLIDRKREYAPAASLQELVDRYSVDHVSEVRGRILDPQENKILDLAYGESKSPIRIADELSLPSEQVSKTLNEALHELETELKRIRMVEEGRDLEESSQDPVIRLLKTIIRDNPENEV